MADKCEAFPFDLATLQTLYTLVGKYGPVFFQAWQELAAILSSKSQPTMRATPNTCCQEDLDKLKCQRQHLLEALADNLCLECCLKNDCVVP